MAQVATVRGPINSTQIETILMHEHIFVLDTEIVHEMMGEKVGAMVVLKPGHSV